MKSNLSLAIQQAHGGNNHFSNLLEGQSRELVRLKRQIEEFEKREK